MSMSRERKRQAERTNREIRLNEQIDFSALQYLKRGDIENGALHIIDKRTGEGCCTSSRSDLMAPHLFSKLHRFTGAYSEDDVCASCKSKYVWLKRREKLRKLINDRGDYLAKASDDLAINHELHHIIDGRTGRTHCDGIAHYQLDSTRVFNVDTKQKICYHCVSEYLQRHEAEEKRVEKESVMYVTVNGVEYVRKDVYDKALQKAKAAPDFELVKVFCVSNNQTEVASSVELLLTRADNKSEAPYIEFEPGQLLRISVIR